MEEAISAADADRWLSPAAAEVREGRDHVVTSQGKPVARLIPAGKREEVATGARTALRHPAVCAARQDKARGHDYIACYE
jgi:prevent-host-death family protein